MFDWINRLLESPPILHIRRHHALEHATIHVLSRRFPGRPFIGRSDAGGFFILGDIATDDLEQVVLEALRRLKNGEAQYAIHPNCGTSLLTAGVLAGGASFLALQSDNQHRFSERLARLPLAVMAASLALLFAAPLGRSLQRRLTTKADLGGMQVISISRIASGRARAHRVLTSR